MGGQNRSRSRRNRAFDGYKKTSGGVAPVHLRKVPRLEAALDDLMAERSSKSTGGMIAVRANRVNP